MKRRGLVFFIIGCFLLVSSFYLSCSSKKEEGKAFKIGLIGTLTGPMAAGFKTLNDAAKPAADLMNKRGGITVEGKKYMIEIVIEDDQSTPTGSVAALNKLMQAGIKFIYAPQFMPNNMAITPIAEKNKIFRIKGLGVGVEEVGPELRYSFYASNQLSNIPINYDYLQEKYPKVKKIAIITPDDPGAATMRNLTELEIKKRGLQLVFKEAFKMGSEDFYPILTKALAKKPDAIDMIISITPWAAGVINQSRELGFKGPVFATIFGDNNILRAMLTPKFTYDIFHSTPDVLSPKMTPLMKDYRKVIEEQTKTTFMLDHAIFLEGLYSMVQAIEKAQSFDTEKVVVTLENMKNIDTIYGPGIVGGKELFGINHVIIRPFFVSRLMKDNTEFEFRK